MKTFIIIVVILALAAVAGPIIIGMNSFDGTVTENYYEKGLEWDSLRKKKELLGWDLKVSVNALEAGGHEVGVSAFGKNGATLDANSLSIKISRPASARYDMYPDSVEEKEGEYKYHVDFPLFGYWDIEVNVTKDEDAAVFIQRIFVENGGDAL